MTWRQRLAGCIDEALAAEIDLFETQIAARKQGKIDEAVFGETRLRRGVYGQRYDNGLRHDGTAQRTIAYPSAQLRKGTDTLWDAPGMQRIKIPHGDLSSAQLIAIAAVAEEHADGICHLTTRQDVQLHYVHIEDTPTIMRRLAAVGITTREACGNVVRNITCCPVAGVCATAPFDVTPYADAMARFLLGHAGTQDFGRKLKVSFSGCTHEACGLATINDIGLVAAEQPTADGTERGFTWYVGGGLGAVPHTARLLFPFLPVGELLPTALAICRVFSRLGERRNRAHARLKFVVQRLGVEAFAAQVHAERERLEPDPRWVQWLPPASDRPPPDRVQPPPSRGQADDRFADWLTTNTKPQRQDGLFTVTVRCPLGDLSGEQLRAVAAVAERHARDLVRTTMEQNLVLRWVPGAALEQVHRELDTIGLGEPGASSIADVVACPGTDTCKLGIAASRGLAAELARQLARGDIDGAVRPLRIKISGCFNSCAQHQIADIGFWGVSRKVGNHVVPHFQAVVGGQWSENAKSYGVAIGAVPARQVPLAVACLTEHFLAERARDESFQAFVARVGKAHLRKTIEHLLQVPPYDDDPSFYSDWGDPRQFTIGDLGLGECAGELVSEVQFGLAAAERMIFEAQELVDGGRVPEAAGRAFDAMLRAALVLTRERAPRLGDAADEIVSGFRSELCDSGLFYDKYAGAKFARYLFAAHEQGVDGVDLPAARQRIGEAQLFVEAAHQCYQRMVDNGEAT